MDLRTKAAPEFQRRPIERLPRTAIGGSCSGWILRSLIYPGILCGHQPDDGNGGAEYTIGIPSSSSGRLDG